MGAAKSSKEICEAIGDPRFGFDEKLIPGIFAHFDTGPNGYLNRPDATRFFKKIVKHSGGLWTEMDFPRWFVALDPDGEGKLRRANISKRAVAANHAQHAMQLDNSSSVLEPSLTKPIRPPTPP